MDDAKFRDDFLRALTRVEEAVKIMVDRIATLESSTRSEDSHLWGELRKQGSSIQDQCSKKRAGLLEITQDKLDRLGADLKEDIRSIQEQVDDWEERVLGVERGMSAGETTTRSVTSLSSRLDNLSKCMTGIKIELAKLVTRLEVLERRGVETISSRRYTIQTIISVVAIIVAISAAAASLITAIQNAT
jgi:prefoldin subunit 5